MAAARAERFTVTAAEEIELAKFMSFLKIGSQQLVIAKQSAARIGDLGTILALEVSGATILRAMDHLDALVKLRPPAPTVTLTMFQGLPDVTENTGALIKIVGEDGETTSYEPGSTSPKVQS